MGIGAAIVGSAVIGGIGASKAASAQKAAADKQAQVQWDMYEQTRDDLSPYRDAGGIGMQAYLYELGLAEAPTFGGNTLTVETVEGDKRGLSGLFSNLGTDIGSSATTYKVGDRTFSTYDEAQAYADANSTQGFQYQGYRKTPGYDFRLNEGTSAIEASAAARGGLNSGAAQQALLQYGQDYASSEYGNYLNRLAGLSDMGQGAASQQAAANANTAAGVAQAYGNRGDAAAAGYMGVANSVNQGLSNYIGYQNYLSGLS